MARKCRENGEKHGNLLLCKIESGQLYWPLLSGIKVFALLWFSCMSDQIIY